jgi:hypothetical protein
MKVLFRGCKLQSTEREKEAMTDNKGGCRKRPRGVLPAVVQPLAEMSSNGKELFQRYCALTFTHAKGHELFDCNM